MNTGHTYIAPWCSPSVTISAVWYTTPFSSVIVSPCTEQDSVVHVKIHLWFVLVHVLTWYMGEVSSGSAWTVDPSPSFPVRGRARAATGTWITWPARSSWAICGSNGMICNMESLYLNLAINVLSSIPTGKIVHAVWIALCIIGYVALWPLFYV
jgi:hypothetical protein